MSGHLTTGKTSAGSLPLGLLLQRLPAATAADAAPAAAWAPAIAAQPRAAAAAAAAGPG